MNKTVTINLSGIVFHIDENAYELLKKYLERLKQHFANTQGKEEIIADIESRMAEMFTEKNADVNRVIMQADVNEVFTAMGKPEDLPGDEEEETKGSAKSDSAMYYESSKKRFFRNPEDKIIGGVCSGIAAYFDIDPLWIRLAFVFFAIVAFGTGLLIYIILWIIIPVAKTASEKLEMRGERVNIANIEKNVREEMESLRKKGAAFASDLRSDETRAKVRSASQKVGDFFTDVIRGLAKLIAIVFGVLITIISVSVLIGITVAIFAGFGIFRFAIPHTVLNMILTYSQLWWIVIGGMLAIGIPFTLLLLNGLKILFKVKLNLKMIGAVMAGLWLIGIGICVIVGIHIASDYQRSATIKQNEKLTSTSSGRLYIKALKSAADDGDSRNDFVQLGDLFVLDENGDSVLNSMVRFDIEQSDNDSTYLITSYYSRGKTYEDAKHLASEINYRYRVTDSVLVLPNYFDMSTATKYRGQNVKLLLKLPAGKSVVLDKSLGGMLDDVANVTDTWDWDMVGHEWSMTKDGLTCTDCSKDSTDQKNHHKRAHIHISSNGVDVDAPVKAN